MCGRRRMQMMIWIPGYMAGSTVLQIAGYWYTILPGLALWYIAECKTTMLVISLSLSIAITSHLLRDCVRA